MQVWRSVTKRKLLRIQNYIFCVLSVYCTLHCLGVKVGSLQIYRDYNGIVDSWIQLLTEVHNRHSIITDSKITDSGIADRKLQNRKADSKITDSRIADRKLQNKKANSWIVDSGIIVDRIIIDSKIAELNCAQWNHSRQRNAQIISFLLSTSCLAVNLEQNYAQKIL